MAELSQQRDAKWAMPIVRAVPRRHHPIQPAPVTGSFAVAACSNALVILDRAMPAEPRIPAR